MQPFSSSARKLEIDADVERQEERIYKFKNKNIIIMPLQSDSNAGRAASASLHYCVRTKW